MGYHERFTSLLMDVVNILDDRDALAHYEEQPDFKLGMAEVHEALASDMMSQLLREQHSAGGASEERVLQLKRSHNAYMAKANEHEKYHGYHFLIKAFYHLRVDGNVTQAENQFRIMEKRAENSAKEARYLSGALIGLGITAYAAGKYQLALKSFGDGLAKNPDCHAGVRVAIASCLFKLGEYKKSREAVMNALKLDASSADAYAMLALVEQADGARGDKAVRAQHLLQAYEYWRVVAELDPTYASAYVHQASFHLQRWQQRGAGEVLNQTWLRLDLASMGGAQLQARDRVLVSGVENAVKEFIPEDGSVMITLEHPLAEELVGQQVQVSSRSYAEVLAFLDTARSCTTRPHVLSECSYIEGCVEHERGDFDAAARCYEQALEQWKDMVLAASALAKVCLARGDSGRAQQLFQSVAKRSPDDKDTQAYLSLLRAQREGQTTEYEKVKGVALDFEFDAQLWLAQAELRHRKSGEQAVALKCYHAALECFKSKGEGGDDMTLARLLDNIAALQQGAGKLGAALESSKAALRHAMSEADADADASAAVASLTAVEFEGIFYKWAAAPAAQVTRGEADRSFAFHGVAAPTPALSEGDQVLVDDVLHTVQSAAPGGFTAYSPVDVFAVGSSSGAQRALTLKERTGHFSTGTVTMCYNFARILEDSGCTVAATQLYNALIKQNPALIEAYLRLSNVSQNRGNVAGALSWACRGLAVDDRNVDALSTMAELRARGVTRADKQAADAIVNELLKSQDGDPRPLVLLGNMRFEDAKGAADERVMKQCRKYFFTPLSKDPTNVYAANGLGMVCCEYGEFDVASEIFLRAKELGLSASEDINNNLANAHLVQGRMAEAEHLYALNMRLMAKSGRALKPGSVAYCAEMSGCAQYRQKRHEEAVRTLLRGMHSEPLGRNNMLRFWFNIAHVRANKAHALITFKGLKSVRSVQDAIAEFDAARELFTALAEEDLPSSLIGTVYNPVQAKQNATLAESWLGKCDTELQDVERAEQANLEERERRNRGHQERMQRQAEEKAAAAAALTEARAAKERQAAEKQQRLNELKAGWQAAPVAADKGKGGKAAASDPEVINYDSDEDIEVGGMLSAKNETDPFADDSDDDDEIFGNGGNKRKASGIGAAAVEGDSEGEAAAAGPSNKKLKRVEESDDEDALFGEETATQPQPSAGSKEMDDLFNSDEE